MHSTRAKLAGRRRDKKAGRGTGREWGGDRGRRGESKSWMSGWMDGESESESVICSLKDPVLEHPPKKPVRRYCSE